MGMFDSVSSVALHSALDGLALRQRVIADNVANIQTPGYHAQTRLLRGRARRGGRPRQRRRSPRTVARSLEPTREDGNNVNLDDRDAAQRRHQPALPAGDRRPCRAQFSSVRTAMRTS